MNKKALRKKLNDGIYYCEEILGNTLWKKQKEIINSIEHFQKTTVRSCNGAGKSFISARVALHFLSTKKNSIVITTAPTFKQVANILWREIRTAYNLSPYEIGGTLLQTAINISDKWYAFGGTSDEPSNFQGYHAEDILIIIDEASGIKEEIFDAIEGNLTSERSRLLMIGNPIEVSGVFFQSHRLETYNKIHIAVWDTPNFTAFGITRDDILNGTWEEKITGPLPFPGLVTPRWVADKVVSWGTGSPMWDARIEGNFPELGTDTLIPLIYVEQAAQRELTPKDDDEESIGGDFARFGDDKIVFTPRKGPKVKEQSIHQKMDTMASGQIADHIFKSHPFAHFNGDIIGLGSGPMDRLRQLNPMREDMIHDVNVAIDANDSERFINLRAEIFWSLRERFIAGDIDIPDDDELKAQLSSIKYKFDSRGRIQIESKEDMKKRGLPSPDRADSLALAFYKGKDIPSILEYMKKSNSNP